MDRKRGTGDESKSVKRPKTGGNCAECRRLKIKCDRQFPCQSCVKRGCGDQCPGGTIGSLKEMIQQSDRLARRVHELEDQLRASSSVMSESAGPLAGEVPPAASVEASGGNADAVPGALLSSSTNAPDTTVVAGGPPEDRRLADPGTLIIGTGGRSKLIGPSANPQWTAETSETRPPSLSRGASPDPLQEDPWAVLMFPLASDGFTVDQARAELPPFDEIRMLVDCYFRLCAWNSSPVVPAEVDNILSKLGHDNPPTGQAATNQALQEHSLVFALLALGTLVNMELPSDDSSAMHYFQLSQRCLSAAQFLVHNTLTICQVLAILGRFAAYSTTKASWDLAWQIRGIASRISLAMGLHRDGQSWQLPPHDLDRRRRIFWDIYTAEIYLSRNWGRPPSLSPAYVDTEMPLEFIRDAEIPQGGFDLARCRLSVLTYDALDASLRLKSLEYSRVTEIWRAICHFEEQLAPHFRCRAALKVMVSRYPTAEAAEAASTEPSRRHLRLTLQQFSLCVDACGTVFVLLRPYFVRALQDNPDDPTGSPYADAYLALVERSSMLIEVLRNLQALFPLVSTRHWFFWTHAFSAAVCMATVCIMSPNNPLVDLAQIQLDSVIDLFQTLARTVPRRSVRKNVEWLQRLRVQVKNKLASHRTQGLDGIVTYQSPVQVPDTSDDYLGLVGWRTRLVRLGRHRSDDQAVPAIDPDWTQLGQIATAFDTPTQPVVQGDSDFSFDLNSPDLLQQLLQASTFQPVFPSWPNEGEGSTWPARGSG